MLFRGTVILTQEENWIVASCVENHVASQGKTIDEAMRNLREAIALYYEDESEEKFMPTTKPVFMTTLEMAL